MAIPVAQAGIDQSHAFSTLPTLVTLAGNATNGPITAWQWSMLSVPVGSSANSGVNNDFTNGVANIQNPQFTADVYGAYVLQLRAQNNGTDWSDPAVDEDGAQTIVFVLTEKLGLKIPGYLMYRYDDDLNETLLAIEADLYDHATRHQVGGPSAINVGGLSGVLADAQNASKLQGRDVVATAPTNLQVLQWVNGNSRWEPATIAIADEKIKVTASDTTPGYMDGKIVVGTGTGLKKTIQNPGGVELYKLEADFGTVAQKVCDGGDARLSDARPPTGNASGDLGNTYPSPKVAAITESGGQQLTLGAVSDGQYLKRSGVTLVGEAVAAQNNTLDGAYDQGGAGAGRSITADSGAVEINASLAGGEALKLDGALGMPELSAAPTFAANKGFWYTKDVAGVTEAFYMDQAGNEIQFTSNGALNTTPFSSPLTTKGDIYCRNATVDSRLPAGSDTQLLSADASETTGLKWIDQSALAAGTPYEEELVSTGDTSKVLTAQPKTAVNTLAGYELQVYKNGVRMRHVSSVAAENEYNYVNGTKTCSFLASAGSVYHFVYRS